MERALARTSPQEKQWKQGDLHLLANLADQQEEEWQ
jgi:hypothetical protein